MARPALKTKQVNIKLSPEQYAAVMARSTQRNVPFGIWARSILLQVAEQKPKRGTNGAVEIQEPSGATS